MCLPHVQEVYAYDVLTFAFYVVNNLANKATLNQPYFSIKKSTSKTRSRTCLHWPKCSSNSESTSSALRVSYLLFVKMLAPSKILKVITKL